jgi:hypothetical protein
MLTAISVGYRDGRVYNNAFRRDDEGGHERRVGVAMNLKVRITVEKVETIIVLTPLTVVGRLL